MTKIQFYFASIFACIDGTLQHETFQVSTSQGREVDEGAWKNRVAISWGVPETGLEFDGGPHVGTDHAFEVILFALPHDVPPPVEVNREDSGPMIVMAQRRMTLQSFEVGQRKPDGQLYARAVFESYMFPSEPQ